MMKLQINSTYHKLVLALLASFLVVGLVLMGLAHHLTKKYQNEVEQKLHLDLAEHVVHDNQLLKNGEIDSEALKKAFHTMMILGPSFEFYVLDTQGRILAYSANPEKIVRKTVDLTPIHALLAPQKALPILGQDPRSQVRRKIFSVAKIHDQKKLTAYLYIIIGGEIYDNVVALLQGSHIVTLGSWLIISGLGFGLIIVLWLFALITKPLRRLAKDMQSFRKQGFSKGELKTFHWDAQSKDEIHRLGTTFREMSQALASQYHKVKSTDELRKELLSYISHDLRTPLASLEGYLETWQLKKDTLPQKESEKYIQTAISNAKKMHLLVEQLFELAHLDSAEVQLNKEPVAIAELAQDVLQKFQIEAEEKGITLDVSPKDPAIIALADIEKLDRVFTNLIDNALRHCSRGDSIQIRLANQADSIEITFTDTGLGIAKKDLPYLFDPHFKAENSVKSSKANSGLGLAITKRLLELHQTTIQVQSQLGQGTTFFFSLARRD